MFGGKQAVILFLILHFGLSAFSERHKGFDLFPRMESLTTASRASSPFADIFTEEPTTPPRNPYLSAFATVRFERRDKHTHWHKGFVTLANGREVYAEYRPAQNGKQTLVFLNGLTHSVKNWDSTIARFKDPDMGILVYDAIGQGATLQEVQRVALAPIPLINQADDLLLLLERLNIKTKVNLVGLSYGGGLSIFFANKFPQRVGKVMALAPFTERLPDQDMLIRKWIAIFKQFFPYLDVPTDVLYDVMLANMVLFGYPLAEREILDFPQKPYGAYQMVREMKNFVAMEHVSQLTPKSLHLVVAGMDQYIPAELPNRFWNAVPWAGRGSRLDLRAVEHKISEDQPSLIALWIEAVLSSEHIFNDGLSFDGQAGSTIVTSGETVIDLNARHL